MKKLNLAYCIMLGAVVSLSYGLDALASNVEDIVNRVDDRYAKTQDLQGEFTQETIIEGFESGFTSSGKFYLKKPGLLRWDYIEPSKEHIYVDGDAVMMYVPEHQQVVKGTLTQMAASKGPLALLLGVGKLSQQFTILETSEFSRGSKKPPDLILIPKQDGDTAPTIKRSNCTYLRNRILFKPFLSLRPVGIFLECVLIIFRSIKGLRLTCYSLRFHRMWSWLIFRPFKDRG